MKELMSYYRFIVKQRVKALNHLESLTAKEGSTYVISVLKKRVISLKKKEQEILMQIKKIITKDDVLQRGFEHIKSIIGIGDVAAIALLHLFMRYEGANRAQIVSLTGLDPIERSSGTSVRSRMKISKAGDRIYRGTLFMSAMVAIRHNEEIKAFFERLKASGKHTTIVQIAVIRKLIVIAHSLYKNNNDYDPERHKIHSGHKVEAA